MPAVATTILDRAKAELEALYPALRVFARKEPVFQGADPHEAFFLAIQDGEQVEDLWYNTVLVRYPLTVIHGTQVVTPGWSETPAVRDVREAVRKRFLRQARTWLPEFNDITVRPRKPYARSTDKHHMLSTLEFEVQTIETRTG